MGYEERDSRVRGNSKNRCQVRGERGNETKKKRWRKGDGHREKEGGRAKQRKGRREGETEGG